MIIILPLVIIVFFIVAVEVHIKRGKQWRRDVSFILFVNILLLLLWLVHLADLKNP